MRDVFVNSPIRSAGALICAMVLLAGCRKAITAHQPPASTRSAATQPVTPDSVRAPAKSLAAWEAARLGLFIHWGPWSQTGIGRIWHIQEVPPAERAQYLELFKTFNPIRFDPAAWARIAKDSGARYVVFTAKHHDGFCNFNTALTDCRITSAQCPYSASSHPDVAAQLLDACRDQGLMTGVYYSHIDWHHPDGAWCHLKIDPAFIRAHPGRWRRFVDYEQGQVRELLTGYGHVDLFWFDITWPSDGLADAVPMLRMMRTLQPEMLINDRGTGKFADFVTPEQNIPDPPPAGPWETCITVSQGDGFWYKGPDAKFKSAAELIRLLADVASKGGNLLLDVGPHPDGTFVPEESDRLNKLGRWLARNGESIYGTTRSPLASIPKWGRITRRDRRLYLIVLEPPPSGGTLHLAIKQRADRAVQIPNGQPVTFHEAADGSGIDLTYPGSSGDGPGCVIAVDLAA